MLVSVVRFLQFTQCITLKYNDAFINPGAGMRILVNKMKRS